MSKNVAKRGTVATLLIYCPDRPGLVAQFANFIFNNGGNIIHNDQHTDFEAGLFLTRIEWQLDGFKIPRKKIEESFSAIAQPLQAEWELHFSDHRTQMAIWVSRQDHCLYDLLLRQQSGELDADIPLIISNHQDLKKVADQFNIEFRHFPIDPKSKKDQENKQAKVLKDFKIDLVVLAKYMQILSGDFLKTAPPTMNIHHSFLPAFAGAKPYERALKRGVKVIGATAHYVTKDLDAGPIIEQDITRVSHRHDLDDLVRVGKDIERMVLARAVRLHLNHRVLVYKNRTVVFS